MFTNEITKEQFNARLANHLQVVEELSQHFSILYGYALSHEDIRLALFERLSAVEDLKIILDIYRITLDLHKCKEALSGYDFSQLQHAILIDVNMLPDGIVPDTYATIKDGGKKWRIHLNDMDHWPSKPHAHFVGTSIVLDLSNGNLYERRTHKDKLTFKTLVAIRTKFEQLPAFSIKLPPLSI